jgi:hypothetical protein
VVVVGWLWVVVAVGCGLLVGRQLFVNPVRFTVVTGASGSLVFQLHTIGNKVVEKLTPTLVQVFDVQTHNGTLPTN